MVAVVRAIPDSGINSQITHEREAAQPEAALLKDYRAYMRGAQLDPRTTQQRAMFPMLEKHAYCDNVCRRIVLTPTNRLSIARFDVEGEGAATEAIKTFIADTQVLNRFKAFTTAVNVATVRDGDHAVALRWVNDAPRFVRESWWNGEDGMFVAYDDDDLPTYAVKEWSKARNEQSLKRRVVYYPDRMERYASTDGGSTWEMINLLTDPYQGGVSVPWTVPATLGGPMLPDGEPIGLMIVHYANQLIPNDGAGGTSNVRADSRYGMSLLAGGVLGAQDRVNLIHFDVIATSSFTGTQMLWAAGVTLPINPDTKLPEPFAIVPGSFVTNGSKDARFGSFPPGNVDAHEKALMIEKRAIAETTGLPYVALSGQTPSGEALMHMEADLAETVDKLAEVLGPSYASLMHKATRLGNVFGQLDLDETLRIETAFTPAQRINPLMLANQLVQLVEVEGRREALKDSGKNPDEIGRIVTEVEEEQRTRTANANVALDASLNLS